MPATPQPGGLLEVLAEVPRSARWVLPALASAFCGTDVSTLELRTRSLVLLRVVAVDRAPYWRLQLAAGARELGITEDELALIGSDEWEAAPAFSERERAAILWGIALPGGWPVATSEPTKRSGRSSPTRRRSSSPWCPRWVPWPTG
jgi:hypothetical protein